MRTKRARGVSRARSAVVVLLAATIIFSLYLAYVAWSSSSFPVQERPFSRYAVVTSTQFNGTELYFRVQWNASGEYVPLYAQISSPQTDAANSPVCELGVSSVARGQMLDLPFAVSAPKQALASVDLAIAVRAGSNMTEFTIVHHLDHINAQPGNITPSDFACSQPTPANL